ncbi:MAG: polysaccharide pyruvyl transferase family protein [Candidatus Riflebacteria bacterium]|nr:polysaccharide pyruvyl transferase family protein [Candidatus Riflebacteria bacterium]
MKRDIRDFFAGNPLILIVLLPGLIIALMRCADRISVEKSSKFVETVIDFEETRKIARIEGKNLAETLNRFSLIGASSVGISEDTLASLSEEGRISVFPFQEICKRPEIIASFPAIRASFEGKPASLLVFSEDIRLLERIRVFLQTKMGKSAAVSFSPKHLFVEKNGQELFERIGLGFSEEYLNIAKSIGMGIVLRPQNYPGLSCDSLFTLFQIYPAFDDLSAVLFSEEEVIGNRGDLKAAAKAFLSKSELAKKSTRVGRVEFNDQEGMAPFLNLLGSNTPVVRVHSIGRKELEEIYDVPRATARWVRAVRDRSLKMLYIRFFMNDPKKIRGDLVQYNLDYVSGISGSLKNWGYKIPTDYHERIQEPRNDLRSLYWIERIIIGISLFAGLPLLCFAAFGTIPAWVNRYFFILPPFILSFLLSKVLFISLFGLIGAVCWSSIGCILSATVYEKYTERGSRRFEFYPVLFFIVSLVLPSLIGGILTAGFHAESSWLLHLEQFRGIKIAFLLPLLIVSLWSLHRYGFSLLSAFNRPLTIINAMVVSVVLFAGVVYLLRSGNVTFLKPSATEDFFRTMLEDTMIARPRNKEFLIGYPAAILFAFAGTRGVTVLLPLLLILMEMGQVSVVNTFCHFHSPLLMGIIRTSNGLLTGLLIGLSFIFMAGLYRFARAILKKGNSGVLLGYFGFGNLGDELLWTSYVNQVRKLVPDFKWYIITREKLQIHQKMDVEAIPRRNIMEMLEAVAQAKVMVIPGGGVLQCSTSRKSLVYYAGMLLIGRILGTKIVLPAQGIGPWHNSEKNVFLSNIVAYLAGYIVEHADYLSVRDQVSQNFLKELNFQNLPSVTTDIVFLCEPSIASEKPVESGVKTLRLGAVIRASNKDAQAVVREVLKVGEIFHNLEIVPIVFQPGEDEKIWIEAGLSEKMIVLETMEHAEEVFKTLDLIVSMRLHGCILATILGLPWVGLSHDPKIRGLADEMKWSFVFNTELFTRDLLINIFPKIVEKRKQFRESLQSFVQTRKSIAIEDIKQSLEKIPL